jgi:hypothetical protein
MYIITEKERKLYRQIEKTIQEIKTEYYNFEDLLNDKIDKTTISIRKLLNAVVCLYRLNYLSDRWFDGKQWRTDYTSEEVMSKLEKAVGSRLIDDMRSLNNSEIFPTHFICEKQKSDTEDTDTYKIFYNEKDFFTQKNTLLARFYEVKRLLRALELILRIEIISENTYRGLSSKMWNKETKHESIKVCVPNEYIPKKETDRTQKHRWTFEEDKTCCRIFIETYITNHTSCSLDSLATKILSIYPNMKVSSIKMKLQNIKRICLDYGIKDSSTISPLDNYSGQNLRAMRESLRQIGITI